MFVSFRDDRVLYHGYIMRITLRHCSINNQTIEEFESMLQNGISRMQVQAWMLTFVQVTQSLISEYAVERRHCCVRSVDARPHSGQWW